MTTIWTTFQIEGWHRWPDAPQEVGYLSARHRHIFHFRVEISVRQLNREIELHQLRTFCLDALVSEHETASEAFPHGLEFGNASCEAIAMWMAETLREAHPLSWVAAEVSEDGECGARVELRALRHLVDSAPADPGDELPF